MEGMSDMGGGAAMAGFGGPPDLSLLQVAIYAFFGLMLLIFLAAIMAAISMPIFFGAMGLMELGLKASSSLPDPFGKYSKLAGLVFRSLRRSFLRTALTYTALFVLTFILTFIYGIVKSLGDFSKEKDGAQMVILTEKFSIPSQMKPGYLEKLKAILEGLPPANRPRPLTDEERANKGYPASPNGSVTATELAELFSATPDDQLTPEKRARRETLTKQGIRENVMTWSFVVGSLDPAKPTKENTLVLFALAPEAIENGMMSEQGLTKEELGPQRWDELLRVMELAKQDKRNIVVGEDKLAVINKKVGDQIRVYGSNYKELEFECTIVGAFPAGTRLGASSAMRFDYLLSKLDDHATKKGTPHPVADRCLNLVWIRMPDKASFEALGTVVAEPKMFSSPAAKIETFSSIIGAFFEPFRDIFWGTKYIVMPAIIAIMCLVIGITITIGVRERLTEMAVMKVLGFLPWQVMWMIVAEAMLIGLFGGMLSTWTVYYVPRFIAWLNASVGGNLKFFDNLKMPIDVVIYGPLLGLTVGFVGALLPSRSAKSVKVSQVFAQVA